ncbi:hypothetical protein [Acinetobacter calcoaceticus]|uniref:hypothetical protein n=1 Tax=Acinetobacter calcoaceticus TaxID=471 RepID=UPI0018DE8BA7|nr:hypothetical protein [Acinetobacter calcoaceticus]
MDKCREEFEQSLGHTDGFHDGYVTWNEIGGMYTANDDEYECVADWMNGAFAIHKKMQAKVGELQEEFAEDERFLKEQIKDKDLKISNLKYLQGMDKDLIQTLQGRSAALQDKINELQKQVDKALELMQKPVIVGEPANHVCARFKELEQALKGEG